MAITIQRNTMAEAGLAWTKNPCWLEVSISAGVQCRLTLGTATHAAFVVVPLRPLGGSLVFELQQFLDDYLERYHRFDLLPDLTATGPVESSFPIQFTATLEELDLNQQVLASTQVTFGAIPAGLGADRFSPQAQAEFLSELRFLNTAPDPDRSHPDCEEFLYFYPAVAGIAAFSVRVTLWYEDGSSENYLVYQNTTLNQSVYIIPTSYAALGIAARETASGQLVHQYTVEIVNSANGTAISEFYRYELDNQRCTDITRLLYRNALGSYDTIFGNGTVAREIESRKSFVERPFTYSSDPRNSVVLDEQTSSRKVSAGTGWLSESQSDGLQGLALSDEVYEIGTSLRPVRVPTVRQEYYRSDSLLRGWLVTYEYVSSELRFTWEGGRQNSPVVAPPGSPAAPPAAPSNLAVTMDDLGAFNLVWLDNASNEDNIELHQKIGSATFQLFQTLAANTQLYDIASPQLDTIYQFRVRARNTAGASAFSDTVQIVRFNTPEITNVASNGSNQPVLTIEYFATLFSAPSTHQLQVERRVAGTTAWASLVNIWAFNGAPRVQTYTDTTAAQNETYEYRARLAATPSSPLPGRSLYSPVVSVFVDPGGFDYTFDFEVQ